MVKEESEAKLKEELGQLSSPEDINKVREYFDSVDMDKESFFLKETLGTGTFGRVRLVMYKDSAKAKASVSSVNIPKIFALKILKKSEILRLKQVEHVKAEKSILMMICHPFIVNMYSSWQDSTSVYMVMEYVIGGELFTQLRKVGRFSNSTARFYAAEIVLALEHLHDQDIVYRDLKPENLLIDHDGHMKITDFGFAKIVKGRTWTLCGTPEYLAPEIIQSKGHGKPVDWWALGIMLFEMIAGYPPFYHENPFGIYQKILWGKVEYPAKVFDPAAKDLVKKLLAPDITKRLGCLKNGIKDIKKHKFFKTIDWDIAANRKLKPPMVPVFKSALDTSNFDEYPESVDGPLDLTSTEQANFDDF